MASGETPAPAEKTFRQYTEKQGDQYAQGRAGYHPNLYRRIIDHHVSTGGQLDTLVDVGCGPGVAVRALASQFRVAIGLDPSQGMVAAARKLGGETSDGQPIRFEISTAEEMSALDDTIQDGTVDLLVASAAAHWFDMARFWRRAARLLRPGGTVAIWNGLPKLAHPSMPNAEAITEYLDDLENRELVPFFEPGNHLVRELYAGMLLPWTIPSPEPAFEKSTYVRTEWGTPGGLNADIEGEELVFMPVQRVNLDIFEIAMGTASPVTRWREANPDKAGTEKDVVKVMRNGVAKLLREAGVPDGEESLKAVMFGILMMVKKG